MRTPAYEKKIAAVRDEFNVKIGKASDRWLDRIWKTEQRIDAIQIDYNRKLDELFVSRNRLRIACAVLAVAVAVLAVTR